MRSQPARAAVLHLQRRAGNRAVVHGLGRGRMLARYESPEHEDIGDKYAAQLAQWIVTPEGRAWVKRYGLDADVAGLATDEYARGIRKIKFRKGLRAMSPGEIIALSGDFFETWEDLATAKNEEVGDYLNAIALERSGILANANARYQEISKQYRKDSKQHYLSLAQRNSPHFTPGNRKQWRKMHAEALALAKQAAQARSDKHADPGGGSEGEDLLEKALFVDAAAGHFLTDAFASGHLFDKDKLAAEITVYLARNPAKAENPEMGTYLAVMDLTKVTPELVVKNVHDRMNREGFEVSNKRGMKWRTFGDQYLAKSEDTQRIAALAVYLSRKQVLQAHAGKDPKPEDVEAFLPDERSVEAANATASTYIPAAVSDVAGLLYRQRSMAKAQFGKIIGGLVEHNIEAIGSPERRRELEQQQETARRTGLPQVPYQFEWHFGK